MVPARILEVAARLRHLMPNLELDGHLNIARYLQEVLEWLEEQEAA